MSRAPSFRSRIRSLGTQPWLTGVAIAIGALVLYVRTMAPTVMWYDMGEFQTAANTLGIAHNTGYPLYMMLGKLFSYLPIGDPAYRISFMSAVLASATLLVMFILLHRLVGRNLEPALATITFAVTSTLWSNSTWAEVYTLNAFLTGLLLLLIVRYRDLQQRRELFLAAFLFGVATGNHRLILALALPLAFAGLLDLRFSFKQMHIRRSAWMVGCFFVGFLLVQAYLPIRSLARPPVQLSYPEDLATFLKIVTTGGQAPQAFYNPFGDLGRIRHWVTILTVYPAFEMTSVGLIIATFGAWSLFRRDRAVFWVCSMIVAFTLVIVSAYGIHDIFNYFLPLYQTVIVLVAFGLAVLFQFAARSRSPDFESRLGMWTPRRRLWLAAMTSLLIPAVLVGRNFKLVDRSKHRDPADYASFVWSVVEPGSVVLADFWSWTPLLYDQVINHRGQGVTVSPAFSSPNVDIDQQLELLEASGTRTYLALRKEDQPGNMLGPYNLHLLAPYVVHGFPTDSNPLPGYKEMLVPRGGLFQVGRGVPDLSIEGVPVDAALADSIRYANGLALVGFDFDDRRLRPGQGYRMDFYWRIEHSLGDDLWADVLFAHSDGTVDTQGGIPVWLASHWIGTGSHPTSSWDAGTIMHTSIVGLVPRSVGARGYELRLLVYESGPRLGLVNAQTRGQMAESVVLADLEVIDR